MRGRVIDSNVVIALWHGRYPTQIDGLLHAVCQRLRLDLVTGVIGMPPA